MKFHVTRDDDGGAVDFFVRIRNPTARLKYYGPKGCTCMDQLDKCKDDCARRILLGVNAKDDTQIPNSRMPNLQ